MDYLDFESTSGSEDDDEMICELDSDEEEQRDNRRLLKMFNLKDPPSKNQRNIQDFEAEMEAELDRRAFEMEVKGGMEHQKSLSRSSSNTSLNKSPRASPVPGTSSSDSHSSLKPKKSNLKRHRSKSIEHDSEPKVTKSVKFSEEPSTNVTTNDTTKPEHSQSVVSKNTAEKLYDELYFDSDEEEDSKKSNDRRRFMTDDELFYDPTSDAKDQAWIDKKRRKSYGESKALPPPSSQGSSGAEVSSQSSGPSSTLPNTDAILNCPACFTTVCHDCQRHELYVEKKNSKKGKKGKIPETVGFVNDSGSDVFNPVICKVCKTQVAMYDNDEVYHFFNVLASQP